MMFYCGTDEEYEALFGNGEGKIPLRFYEPRWYWCRKMTDEERLKYENSKLLYGAGVPLWVATDAPLYYEFEQDLVVVDLYSIFDELEDQGRGDTVDQSPLGMSFDSDGRWEEFLVDIEDDRGDAGATSEI